MMTQAAVRDTTPFMFDRAAECMPRTQLAALQLDRLRKTLERAYAKVPHFRKAFDAARVKPESLKSLDDISALSFHDAKLTCATTFRLACSQCRANRCCACTPHQEPQAGRLWSAIRAATSTYGQI